MDVKYELDTWCRGQRQIKRIKLITCLSAQMIPLLKIVGFLGIFQPEDNISIQRRNAGVCNTSNMACINYQNSMAFS